MGKSELFSYLSAFVTIVLALALTNLIQSFSALLQARRVVRWDGRAPLFALIVSLGVVSEFFSIWGTLNVSAISFARLLWMLAVPTTFALLAYASLPNSVPDDGIDLSAFYESERGLWAALFAIASLLDVMRTVESARTSQQLKEFFVIAWLDLVVISIALLIVGFARGRMFSWVGLLLLLYAVGDSVFHWSIRVAT